MKTNNSWQTPTDEAVSDQIDDKTWESKAELGFDAKNERESPKKENPWLDTEETKDVQSKSATRANVSNHDMDNATFDEPEKDEESCFEDAQSSSNYSSSSQSSYEEERAPDSEKKNVKAPI